MEKRRIQVENQNDTEIQRESGRLRQGNLQKETKTQRGWQSLCPPQTPSPGLGWGRGLTGPSGRGRTLLRGLQQASSLREVGLIHSLQTKQP